MKKILISAAVIVIFAGYAIYQHIHQTPAITSTVPTTTTQTDQTATNQTPTATTTSGGTPPAAGTPPTTATATGQYKDGTYTGKVADAFYGQLQVVAIINGGKLTDVQFPVFPSDRGHTVEISQQDLPILKSEAITSQSANVQIVSGATQTSQAFQQSLQSALSQAM